MQHQENSPSYPYPVTVGSTSSPSEYQSCSHMHDTGSVSSVNAERNENKDWTNISDSAERRHIQNRNNAKRSSRISPAFVFSSRAKKMINKLITN